MKDTLQIAVTKWVEEKIAEFHQVSVIEVEEAFNRHEGSFILETREKHSSHPPTWWFISDTNDGRLLKIAFIWDKTSHDDIVYLRTAYEPSQEELNYYENHSR